MVSTRTETGSIGILANHTPLLGMLAPAELRLYRTEDDVVTFAQGEGYVQVADSHVLLLVEDAIKPDDLDSAELRTKVEKADSEIEAAEDGSEAQAAARREKRRAESWLRISEGESV
jgi:F-type H+-transporting ATPase subunit epsilon